MQELESRNDFGGVEARARFREPPALLDVEHQVAAVQVLHHEEQVRLKVQFFSSYHQRH